MGLEMNNVAWLVPMLIIHHQVANKVVTQPASALLRGRTRHYVRPDVTMECSSWKMAVQKAGADCGRERCVSPRKRNKCMEEGGWALFLCCTLDQL